MLELQCASCKEVFQVKAKVGERVYCPYCGIILRVTEKEVKNGPKS